MHQTDEELVSTLHKKGLKVTPQRLTIYRYLVNSKNHPSAERIYLDVKRELPTISQGTVYKTLAVLADIGAITELKINNGQSRYDSNTEVHVNLICPSCDTITDYHSEEVTKFWNNISKDVGGEITGQRFDIYKLCELCV